MSETKSKMSVSYRIIFIISIFMIVFVLLVGSLIKSPSTGYWVFFWGYTAWLMNKRNNHGLIIFYKVTLWFDVIVAVIAVSILLFSNDEVKQLVGISTIEAAILFTIVIFLNYALFVYFKRQLNPKINSLAKANQPAIDDIYWEQASSEIKQGQRDDTLWARVFSDADGDENKTKARYLKLRVEQLQSESKLKPISLAKDEFTATQRTTAAKSEKIVNGFSVFAKISVGLLFAVLLYVLYVLMGGNIVFSNSEKSSKNGMTSFIDIKPSKDWKIDTNLLRTDIREGRISVSSMSAERLDSYSAVLTKPWNKARYRLGSELVDQMESKNIWWIQNNKIYIRLYNPHSTEIRSILFSFSSYPCVKSNSNKVYVNFEVDEPLKSYSYIVYSALLPFDNEKTLTVGTKCGLIETAFAAL